MNIEQIWCREGESNPHSPFGPADFKSAASANKVFIINDIANNPCATVKVTV
jgi:hypothetical protein